ncbi:hypothetical protein FV219_01535 [Methylobacterium sp. WL122]|nr:hypothetical protein FV219_01535 [Methylobacterium sp. WL122]
MGDVIPLPRRPAPQPPHDFVELGGVRCTVGDVRLVVASEPELETTGPYKVLLMAEGVPPCCLVTLSVPTDTTMEVLVDTLNGYCEAARQALIYASEHPTLLASPPPRGAA